MEFFTAPFKARKNCEDPECNQLAYGSAKVMFWSALFSLAVIGPRIFDCMKRYDAVGFDFVGFIETGILLWLFVWVCTIAVVAHERINNFLTLMINSLSLPGFVIGLTNLLGAGV